MSTYIGAIDQGTTSTRFIVFDRAGRIVSVAQKEHEQIYPAAGMGGARRQRDLAAHARGHRRGHGAARPAGQRPGGHRHHQPARDHRGVGPQDRRIRCTTHWSGRTRALTADGSGTGPARRTRPLPRQDRPAAGHLLQRAQNPLDSGQRPGRSRSARSRRRPVRQYRLVPVVESHRRRAAIHITDCTNASRTQLMNLETLDWDDELLDAFRRSARRCCRSIVSSSEVYGAATLESLKGVPIAGILGDQQAALVGQTCFQPGEAKNTYGTGCFLLMNTGDEAGALAAFGLLTTVAYRFGEAARGLRARRQRRHHRRAGAVDSRQLRADRKELRYRERWRAP